MKVILGNLFSTHWPDPSKLSLDHVLLSSVYCSILLPLLLQKYPILRNWLSPRGTLQPKLLSQAMSSQPLQSNQPLPTNLHTRIHLDVSDVSDVELAYDRIRELEREASTHEDRIRARVLGYLIQEGPSTESVMHVTKEVRSCKRPHQYYEIGDSYIHHFIRICESYMLFAVLFLPL